MISNTRTNILPKIDGRWNPLLLGLPWGSPPGWTSPKLQQRSKLEPQITPDCYSGVAADLLLTELRRILMNTGEVWKTDWAKTESWVKRSQQTWTRSESSGVHLPADPNKLMKVKDLMCCDQLAPGRFSEGKLLQRTRQKVAPQSPEEADGGWNLWEMLAWSQTTGKTPDGNTVSPGFGQIQPKTATKVCGLCTVGVRSGSSSDCEPAHRLIWAST